MQRRALAVLAALPLAFQEGAKAMTDHRGLDLPRGPLELLRDGDGPAIVLIPSLGRGAEDFDPVVPPLVAASFRVLRPEPRGIGGSAPLREGSTLHDMAGDVAAAIEAEAAAPALVIGHAAGNWVARVLAHDRPELVRAVGMLAALVGTVSPPAIRPSISASFDLSRPDEERLVHLRRAYFAPGNDARAWLPGWHPAVSAAQRAAAAATPDKGWVRAAERHPLLYVAAAEDAIEPPPDEAALREALGPRVTRVVVEGAGHALLPERPAAVAEAIIAFARGLA